MDEKLRNACRVFNCLYQNQALNEKVDQELYQLYKDDYELQDYVSLFADEANVSLLRTATSLYIMPKQDNTFLGFTNQDYKNYALKAYPKAVNDDVGVAHFIELVMMNALFGSEVHYYESSLSLSALENMVLKELTAAKDKEASLGSEKKIYAKLYDKFTKYGSEKKQDDQDKAVKYTRKGFIREIINFYVSQNLLMYPDESLNYIRATDRFEASVKKNMLLQRSKEVTLAHLAGGEVDE